MSSNHRHSAIKNSKELETPEKDGLHKHNLRSKNGLKTLSFKSSSSLETPPKRQKREESKGDASPEFKCHFATEKINLPRGKVFRFSRSSSANGSKRNSQSPVKFLTKGVTIKEPLFEEHVDYFREYWKLYLQNESLISDIETTAHSNYKTSKKIFN
jgi:hypothetical protein